MAGPPFTGTVITRPGELNVDHMVLLANAHRSGGWQRPRDRKRAYRKLPRGA